MDRFLRQISVRIFDIRPRLDWLTGLRLPIIVLLAIVSWVILLVVGFCVYLLVQQFL